MCDVGVFTNKKYFLNIFYFKKFVLNNKRILEKNQIYKKI